MLTVGFIDNIKALFKDKQFFFKYLGITTIVSIISTIAVLLCYVPLLPIAVMSEDGNIEQNSIIIVVIGIIAAIIFLIFMLAITVYSVAYVFQFFKNIKDKLNEPIPNPFVSKMALIQGFNLTVASTVYGLVTVLIFGIPTGLIIWLLSSIAQEGSALMIILICVLVLVYIVYFLFALFFSAIISPSMLYHIIRYGAKGGFMIGSIWNMSKKYFKDFALSFLKYMGSMLLVSFVFSFILMAFQLLMYIPVLGVLVSFVYIAVSMLMNIPTFHLMFSYYKTIYPIFEEMDRS